MSRRPEAHLGYGIVLNADEVDARGTAALAYARNMPRALRETYNEIKDLHELPRVWKNPTSKIPHDVSAHHLLDDLGRLHGVGLFPCAGPPYYEGFESSALVFRDTWREQDLGFADGIVLPAVPEDLDRLANFLALLGALPVAQPLRWIFSVTNI